MNNNNNNRRQLSSTSTNCDSTLRSSESDALIHTTLTETDMKSPPITENVNSKPKANSSPHHVVCTMEKFLPTDETCGAGLMNSVIIADKPAMRRITLTITLSTIGIALLLLILFLVILILTVHLVTRNSLPEIIQLPNMDMWPDKAGDGMSRVWNKCINYSQIHDLCFPGTPCIPRLPEENFTETKIRVPRLEMHFTPQLYTLTLQTHLHMNETDKFYFNGSVRIEVSCFRDTDVFQINVLHLNLTHEGIIVREMNETEDGNILSVMSLENDIIMQWYSIKLNGTLKKGRNYEIYFPQFSGKLRKTLVGLYISDYEENGMRRYLATSQLQPTDARRVFPCFDEPALKAKFQVTIIRHKDFHSLTNMPLQETQKIDDLWMADVHETSLKMSTYLLGFVVSQFKNLTKYDSKNRRFSVWCRPDMIHTANYSLHIGIRILEFFEEFFEMSYPLNKTDMVAVPDFQAGAMENWGVIIYREMTMLWDPVKSSEDMKQKVAVVVSHEIAHQWFGNLVTLHWWDDLWLNEGFASFVEYLGVAMIHPNWSMDDQFVSCELLAVMSLDSSPTSHPVQMPVYDAEEISSIFDSISYNKGASIIRMMEQFLGVGIFQRGLKKYLSRHRYKNTVYDDLWQSLADQAASENRFINLKEIMDVWIKQTGYPVVTVQRINENQVFLSQEIFMTKTHSNLSSNFTESIWKIPISYTDQSELAWNLTDRVFWLNTRNATMTLPKATSSNEWAIFNLRRAGVYRVNYDNENWEKLIHQFKTNHLVIPAIHRASIFDDLFNLARNGLVNYSLFFRMGEYLKEEKEFVPWQTAVRTVSYLDALLSTQAFYGFFVEYVKDIMDPIYMDLGWDSKPEDDHLQKMLRPLIITALCHVGHEKCAKEAVLRFKEWQKDPSVSNTSDNLMGVVFCQGIRNGDSGEWNELFDKTKTMSNNNEVIRALKGLGCSRDPWILKLYLNMMLFGKRFTGMELSEVAMSILKNPLGEYVIWELLSSYSQNVTNGAISILSNSQHANNHLVKNKFHVNQLLDLRQNWRRLLYPPNPRVLDQLIETGKQNLYWMETHSRSVADWLATRYPYKSNSKVDDDAF